MPNIVYKFASRPRANNEKISPMFPLGGRINRNILVVSYWIKWHFGGFLAEQTNGGFSVVPFVLWSAIQVLWGSNFVFVKRQIQVDMHTLLQDSRIMIGLSVLTIPCILELRDETILMKSKSWVQDFWWKNTIFYMISTLWIYWIQIENFISKFYGFLLLS